MPIPGVSLAGRRSTPVIDNPAHCGSNWQVSGNEFALQVPGVGSFYARDGKVVEYSVEKKADNAWVRLYLNGQVLVALLHQRRIINFHASSFVYNGLGIMVLGKTGAGKSSLTLAFALRNGGFLTDDITPVVFEGSLPCIMPLNRRVKIRRDTAEKLGIDISLLSEAEIGTNKKYLSLEQTQNVPHPLHLIISIAPGNPDKIGFINPPPAEKFSLLRSEVCSWEILAGMPETEKAYLEQLVRIVEKTTFIRAERSPETELNDFYESVRGEIMHQSLKPQ